MEHASEIIALDTEKFKIAKKNSDLEIEGERLEQELLQTKGSIEECEADLGGAGRRGGTASALGHDGQDEVL